MIFDPIAYREKAFEDEMLKFYLETEYDAKRPMGNVASSQIGTVIKAWTVGLQNEISPIISRSNEWLDKAINDDEKLGMDANVHRTTLNWSRAIGSWIEANQNDEKHWNNARIFEEARWCFESRPWSTNEVVKGGLDDFMAFSFQAGEYDDAYKAGIEMYERWTGKSGPVSLSKVLKPREYGYALCRYYTGQQDFDENALFLAGRKMLQENLQENWLGAGQMIRAATWLKIVYWHRDRNLMPLQTILKAYDNMPKVPRPVFIMEQV